jgi:hypothetical protein
MPVCTVGEVVDVVVRRSDAAGGSRHSDEVGDGEADVHVRAAGDVGLQPRVAVAGDVDQRVGQNGRVAHRQAFRAVDGPGGRVHRAAEHQSVLTGGVEVEVRFRDIRSVVQRLWPADRVLLHEVEHVCACAEAGRIGGPDLVRGQDGTVRFVAVAVRSFRRSRMIRPRCPRDC